MPCLHPGKQHRSTVAPAAGWTAMLAATTLRTDPPAPSLVADLLAGAGYRSVIVVTHRLTSVTALDEILISRIGRIAARWTPDQLLALPGWYRDRWLSRLGRTAPVG
jgi:ATP-binding cassette, subfamily C, bacterial CydC